MLLDTNILVYSLTKGSPKKEVARKFILENKKNLVVAHQNVNEAIRLLTHPKTPKKISTKTAVKVVIKIISKLRIATPKPETFYLCINLLEKYNIKSNRVFDAYLVATMLTNGISEIATDNEKDFSAFKEIKVLNPFK